MKHLLVITGFLLAAVTIQAAEPIFSYPDAQNLLVDDRIPVYHTLSGSRNITGGKLKTELFSDSHMTGNTAVQKLMIDGNGGVISTQAGPSVVLPFLTLNGSDSGAAPFQVQMQTFPNPGDNGTTKNTGVWLGFNAARHTGGETASPGKPALAMGFEDNYLDAGGDNEYAKEWYVESWSPDGTTVQMSRPFYTRGAQKDDGTDWWATVANIGSSGPLRQFTVREGLNNLLTIEPHIASFHVPLELKGNLDIHGGDLLLDNNRFFRVKNSTGSYSSIFHVGSNNDFYLGDIFNGLGGNVILRTGGKDTLKLSPASAAINVPTQVKGTFEVKGGRLVMDNGQYLQIKNAAGVVASVLHMAPNNNIYLGDIFNGAGGSVYLRSGGNSTMTLSPGGNVGVGTVTPTSKLQVVGLPVFKNNAAAIAGGLTPGAFYRTGADPDPVYVVH